MALTHTIYIATYSDGSSLRLGPGPCPTFLGPPELDISGRAWARAWPELEVKMGGYLADGLLGSTQAHPWSKLIYSTSKNQANFDDRKNVSKYLTFFNFFINKKWFS